MSADHDQQFLRTFMGVLGILVAITFVIIIAANVLMSIVDDGERSDEELARVNEYTQPVYRVFTDPDALQQVSSSQGAGEADSGEPKPGPEVYQAVCSACHASGVAGAPKTGDKGVWSSRVQTGGKEQVYDRAINGYKGMPAKGGDPSLSDQEVKNAVDHILSESGV